MKKPIVVCLLSLLAPAVALAQAPEPAPGQQNAQQDVQQSLGFVPTFIQRYPEKGLQGAWQAMKTIEMSAGELSVKDKQLIGLAVAAQVPCHYCTYFHREMAKLQGATEAEMDEAVALGAQALTWNTLIAGLQVDETQLRQDVDRMTARLRGSSQPTQDAPRTGPVTDAASAQGDIQARFGFVPALFAAVPESALPGLWQDFRGLRLESTALSPALKGIIQTAVAAQSHCETCFHFHRGLASAQGATDAQLAEGVLMAGNTRRWSTVLNGIRMDEAQFKQETDRIIENARKQQGGQGS